MRRSLLVPYALATLLICCLPGCKDDEQIANTSPACDPWDNVSAPASFVPTQVDDLAQYVDPFIGSDGPGNVIPGALVPHGMVRLSPDTKSKAGAIGAYHSSDSRIEGFTHTHLEGPGGSANGYSEILMMPGVGDFNPANSTSSYSHDDEEAHPGYYRVRLLDSQVNVELTATAHAGFHRYTFPPTSQAWVLINPSHNKGSVLDARVSVVGDHVVQGQARYRVHPLLNLLLGSDTHVSETTVYFYVQFDQALSGFGVLDGFSKRDGVRDGEGKHTGAYVTFDTHQARAIQAKVGISFISVDHAKRNMLEEIGQRSFDDVRQGAQRLWNEKLSRVRAEGSKQTLRMFYTSLYHAMFQPADYTEAGGEYVVASSGQPHVRKACGRRYYTDDWCMWDTYRTLHPLGTLVEPELRGDIVESMLTVYREGGWLPKCSWHGAGYSRVMTGNPQVAIIADAWVKGLDQFDQRTAWEAMVKTENEEVPDVQDGMCGYLGLGTPKEYVDKGFVGFECDTTQAASMTLELAYADDCMANVAKVRGDSPSEAYYRKRSMNFVNQWNPAVGFMQPRHRDGSWVEPFDPTDDKDSNGFVEATPWIFSFFVPHQVPKLIELTGGNEAFIGRVDELFAQQRYDASNQPSFHIPWLYNYAGAASKTQKQVLTLLRDKFSATRRGLPGNDDSGAMSAWFTWAAMGLYPVSPGQPRYQISTPLLRRVQLQLNPAVYPGGSFVIETEGVGDYIQTATLNGAPLEHTYLDHAQIATGGVLHLTLGESPSDWGATGVK